MISARISDFFSFRAWFIGLTITWPFVYNFAYTNVRHSILSLVVLWDTGADFRLFSFADAHTFF